MAGPGGREVGRVSIRVLPDTSNFATSLHRYLERIERSLELDIPVSLDAHSVAQTEAELDVLTRDRNINIDLDTRSLISNIGGVTSGFARWAPLILAASVAIGALIAALPAAVALIAAPIAAIALGFDGIKAAASVLKDEFDALRQSLAGTFEQLLTPGFERLAALFPTLTEGLGDIALGVSQIFDAFTRAITTADAMQTIADILTNIGETLSMFAELGGVDFIVDSLLLLTDAGVKATKAITPEFIEQLRFFNDELERMSKNGDLQKAMEGIGHAFIFISIAIGAFVLLALNLFAALERLGEAIFTFATKTVPEAWAALKAQTAADWQAITSTITGAWANIKGTITTAIFNIVGVVKALPGQLAAIADNAANAFVTALMGPLNAVVKTVQGVIDKIVAAFKTALRINSPSKVFSEIGSSVGEGFQLGMEKSFSDVTASATLQIASTVRAASGSSFLPSGAAAGRGVEVTQVINPQPGQSETEIGAAAARKLMFALAGTGA